MKNLSALAIAGLMIGNIASAVVRPGWERPIMGAKLTPISGLGSYYLTLNRLEGSKKPTSFTLSEDTGIRCITTPCPSRRETKFKIVQISPSLHGDGVRYEAVEVFTNIPPNVKIAPRYLFVTESYMELVAENGNGFNHRTMWEVEVRQFSTQAQYYFGYAESLYTIALE